MESGGLFCVGVFGRNVASFAVKLGSDLIWFTKKFYKYCIFNAICKDSSAINEIHVRRKNAHSRQV
jgi:hypothetical protein